ncbi:MAG: hypothetical protein KGH81_07835, partial [Thaumarchaeota archaeon]|nr:hypothetical protein [Nitrososphaerota archaeon]
LSGTWNATTSTCIISRLILGADDSLTVDNSVFPNISLTITDHINNDGTITNSGIINIKNSGTIDNWGKIINNQKGTITNSGILIINELGTIINSGNIVNYATMIHNIGSTITNSGILKNMCGGTFSSSGDFIGNPVDSISCTATSKTSVVPEFPLALPVLVISMTSLIIFYRMKSAF